MFTFFFFFFFLEAKRISELLGIYISADVYVPLVVNLINDEENKTAPKSLTKLLLIFSIMLRAESPSTIDNYLNLIMKSVTSLERTFE